LGCKKIQRIKRFGLIIIQCKLQVASSGGSSLTGIAGSNPIVGMDVCLLLVSVFSGIGLCNGLIASPEFCRVWFF